MNSRQRRKEAARIHNMRRIEEEAYAQDKIEDPNKYVRKGRSKESGLLVSLIGASVSLGMNEI